LALLRSQDIKGEALSSLASWFTKQIWPTSGM
jgi:hypothetical protein